MGKRANIEIPRDKIKSFCKKHHIHKLSFFGSVLRDDFTPDSDVDVLAEFEPNQVVGFFRLSSMEMELSEILGYKVDLRTPAELSRYFRKEVIESAEVQYAEG
jgi:hypothetical protein